MHFVVGIAPLVSIPLADGAVMADALDVASEILGVLIDSVPPLAEVEEMPEMSVTLSNKAEVTVDTASLDVESK